MNEDPAKILDGSLVVGSCRIDWLPLTKRNCERWIEANWFLATQYNSAWKRSISFTPLQNNSNFSIHPSNVDKLFILNSLYCVSMVTVTESAKTMSNSGKRSEMVETNNLDWKANAKHVIAEICIIHKDLKFWTTQKLIDCSLMLYLFQTGWSTCWTRWIARKNSFWNPFADTRE